MNTIKSSEIAQTIAALNAHLSELRCCFNQLATLLEAGSGGDYWREGEHHRRGKYARQAALAFLKTWWYTSTELPAPRYGILYASAQVLALVDTINTLKSAFQLGHERAAQKVELVDRPALLATIKQGLQVDFDEPINLDAIDRKIPVFNQPVVSASWYQETSYSSTRRSVADAMSELEQRIKDAADSPFAEVLRTDLLRLHSLPKDMPLCHRPKAQVRGQYCRLKFVAEKQRGDRVKCWAVNPIFVAYHPSIEAQLEWREPVLKVNDENTLASGGSNRGRARKLQAQAITPNMAHWYAYLPEKPNVKQVSKTQRKAQNPFAKTAYPGIWIGIRWRKTTVEVSLRYVRQKLRDSAVSLGQRSLNQAWHLAVTQHLASFDDNTLVPSAPTLLALCPEQQQLDKAIAWFMENKSP